MFVSQEESGTENGATESLDYSQEWDGDSAVRRISREPVVGTPGVNWARVMSILRLSRQHLRHSLQFTEHV